MKEFNESGLLFRFSDQWEVYQLDKDADYREKICKKVPETKSIDFIGFNENQNILLFVEVKSFRGYGNRTNRKRLTWLTSDVQILNTQNYNSGLEGMEVSLCERRST